MNISSRQLDAFIALARLCSFTQAAAHCHLSQPAFSALIKGLESDTGVRLFDRSTRHVALTQEGQHFLQAVLPIRSDLHEAVQALRDAVALRRGRVSVALLPSLAAHWLPEVLAQFHAQHPQVVLHIHDQLSEPCLALVASGRADFALAATPADTPQLQAEWFGADALHLVCHQDHALARCEQVTVADLLPWPVVQLARSSSVRQCLDAVAYPHSLRSLMEVEHLATVMGMVRAGLGITVVPALALFAFRHPQLVIRPLQEVTLQRQLYLVRQRGRSLSPAAQALYELALAHRPQPTGIARPQTT